MAESSESGSQSIFESLAGNPLRDLNLDPLAGAKQQLWSLLRGQLWFFANRAMVGCIVLHYAKTGLRRVLRKRGKRGRRIAHFITNIALPQGFFGPFLGFTIGIMELTGAIPSLNPQKAVVRLCRRDSQTKSGLNPLALPAAATSLTGKALTAGLSAMQKTAAATGTPLPGSSSLANALPHDKIPAIPADNVVAPVVAFMGLPVKPTFSSSETDASTR